MASGYLVLILIFLGVFIIGILTALCHFCDDSGGRYYGSDQSVFKVMYEKSHANHNDSEEKCDCGKQFKGACEYCQGDKFAGKNPTEEEKRDFAGFGGDDNVNEPSRLDTLTKTLSGGDDFDTNMSAV